jgi:hypothetical protein
LVLVASLTVILVGWLAYRRWGRSEGEDASLGAFAGNF